MKLIILAAGVGSRLGSLTSKEPKPLLQIGNITLIERLIKQFEKHNVRDINVVIGYKGNQIKKRFGNKYNFINYPNFRKTNNLHTLWNARHLLKGNEDVIISFADLLIEDKIVKKIILSKKKITLVIDSTKVRQGTMFVKHIKDKLIKITKLKKKEATGNFVGIIKIRSSRVKNILYFLKSNLKGTEKDYYTIILNNMIEKKFQINVIDIKKLIWSEIDTNRDLILTKKKFSLNFNKF